MCTLARDPFDPTACAMTSEQLSAGGENATLKDPFAPASARFTLRLMLASSVIRTASCGRKPVPRRASGLPLTTVSLAFDVAVDAASVAAIELSAASAIIRASRIMPAP